MSATDPILDKLEQVRQEAGLLNSGMLRTCAAEARALRAEIERLLALPEEELKTVLKARCPEAATP